MYLCQRWTHSKIIKLKNIKKRIIISEVIYSQRPTNEQDGSPEVNDVEFEEVKG